jgi:Lrp/AsnC family transcriptional regulator, regulator for asnA, asnC and gidA
MIANLDALDQQIIVELRHDGRQANTDIARRLGVSEATIRSRVQRLMNTGIVQITAAVNLSRLGYDLHAVIGIECDPASLLGVTNDLARAPEVRLLSVVSGRYDLMATVCLRSHSDLFAFLTERVGQIPGVRTSETLLVLRMSKRDYFFIESPPEKSPGTGDGAL